MTITHVFMEKKMSLITILNIFLIQCTWREKMSLITIMNIFLIQCHFRCQLIPSLYSIKMLFHSQTTNNCAQPRLKFIYMQLFVNLKNIKPRIYPQSHCRASVKYETCDTSILIVYSEIQSQNEYYL